MASWYRKDYERLFHDYQNVDKITSSKVDFNWDIEQTEAFKKIKVLLVSAPIIQRPYFSKTFEIHTDASDTGIGTCFIQNIDGEERIIEY